MYLPFLILMERIKNHIKAVKMGDRGKEKWCCKKQKGSGQRNEKDSARSKEQLNN